MNGDYRDADFTVQLDYYIKDGCKFVSLDGLKEILSMSKEFHTTNNQPCRANAARHLIEVLEGFERNVISRSN